VIPQGQNLFHNQPTEIISIIISIIIDTLQPTEGNMNLIHLWKQLCRDWRHQINSCTDPGNYWQRYVRKETGGLWESMYVRTLTIAQRGEDPPLEPSMVPTELTTDICSALEKFRSSRVSVGGVASISPFLAHTNDHHLETLGANSAIEPSPFAIGRQELQSHLTESLVRHGLA